MAEKKPQFDRIESPPAETLEKYLVQKFSAILPIQKRLSILLTCIGEKPGETVKFLDEDRAERFEEFIQEANLEHIQIGSEYHQKYFFSMKKEFLGLLEDEDEKITPRSIAVFRGLPERRIENPEVNRVQGESDSIEIESEMKHYQALSGIDPVNIDEKKEALELGERRAEIIKQFDRRNSTDIGERLLEELSRKH